ncbi:Uncharacterised protein [Escherichia coli]|nr:Uncharacterised protein [Escherichia coli]
MLSGIRLGLFHLCQQFLSGSRYGSGIRHQGGHFNGLRVFRISVISPLSDIVAMGST